MASGTLAPPWVSEFRDYLGRKIIITVNFNNATRALTPAVLHRDSGCLWNTVVFGDPSSGVSKRITAPADGAADRTVTGATLAGLGFNTIEDATALQITAES